MSTGHLEAVLGSHGYTTVLMPKGGDVRQVARAELLDFVVVAGGDGTLRAQALALVNSGVPVAPLPVGTANNIAKSLGIEGSPEEIVPRWAVDRPRRVDVGVAHGPWGERAFLEGCGIGLIGRGMALIEEIDDATSRRFADPEDKLHRDLSVFVALVAELAPSAIEVACEGSARRDDYLMVEVLNIQHAGPRIHLSKRADPADGYFDVVLATARERDQLHHSLITCLAGSVPDPVLESVRAKVVRLRFRDAGFRIDDEVLSRPGKDPLAAEFCEVTLRVAEAALRIIAPEER